jgi:predicted HAD superfamily Cof-like phosphohydrolase
MSTDWQEDVLEFHKVMGAYIRTTPGLPPEQVQNLRRDLITEEVMETLAAIRDKDVVGLADGIVDSIVVLLGTAISYGIHIQPIWDEVHRTNMLKKGGPVRPDGKRLKPENWEHPRVRELLLAQADAARRQGKLPWED